MSVETSERKSVFKGLLCLFWRVGAPSREEPEGGRPGTRDRLAAFVTGETGRYGGQVSVRTSVKGQSFDANLSTAGAQLEHIIAAAINSGEI